MADNETEELVDYEEEEVSFALIDSIVGSDDTYIQMSW